MTNQTKNKVLSYSKIKTIDSCSEVYYVKYESGLKIPDKGNLGSLKGGISHEIIELLANKDKYYKFVNKLVKAQKLTKSIRRLVGIKLNKVGLLSEENIESCCSYILVFISYDFWFEGCEEMLEPELEFLIDKKEYSIKGFIDRAAIYKDKKTGKRRVVVRDLKTAKQLFTELELKTNIQAMSYLLAVKDKYPDIDLLESEVEFIMVAHPETPIQKFKLKNQQQIDGFIAYLGYIQGLTNNFGEKDRFSNLAANKGFPKKEEGFSGLLQCGIGVNRENELKKDGKTKKFYCSFRFPVSYYVALDKSGKAKYSSQIKSELDKYEKEGFKVEQRSYEGCKFWSDKKENNNREVVDDFEF